VLLLTHSSKATPLTKVLFAISQGESLRYSHDGVRLVTVIEPGVVNTALAATLMGVKRGAVSRDVNGVLTLEPTEIFEPAFGNEFGPKDWIAALKGIESGEPPASPPARKLIDELKSNAMARTFLPRLYAHEPSVIPRAWRLLVFDGVVHRALKKKGYLMDGEIVEAAKQERDPRDGS
jgi:hypothetical protein